MTNEHLDTIQQEAAALWHGGGAKKGPDLKQCHQYALFFAPVRNHGWVLLFFFIIFFALSICMTQMVRSCLPPAPEEAKKPGEDGIQLETMATEIVNAGETTAIPKSVAEERDLELGMSSSMGLVDGEEPPPYAPPLASASTTPTEAATSLDTTSATTTSIPPKTTPRKSAAHLFVVGTSSLLASLISLFLLSLTIQSILFCVWGPLNDTPTSIFYWVLFCIPAFFASVGVGAWGLLFKDLFGKRRTKGWWVFRETVLLESVGWVIFGPFLVIGVFGMVGGQVVVKAVERCQGWCCADALDEDGEVVGNEEGREDVLTRMESTDLDRSMEDGELIDGDRASSSGGDEERVGLIRGGKK